MSFGATDEPCAIANLYSIGCLSPKENKKHSAALFEHIEKVLGIKGNSEGGFFKAHLYFPKEYPLRPPKMKFITEIWHPNIEKNGDVCISILHEPGDDKYGYEKASERWLPVHTVETILISVISMLADPNDESPANVDAALREKNAFSQRSAACVALLAGRRLLPGALLPEVHPLKSGCLPEPLAAGAGRCWLPRFPDACSLSVDCMKLGALSDRTTASGERLSDMAAPLLLPSSLGPWQDAHPR
ncbi:hypothetical protein HPB49_012698 [Dermacentor silvarum]|uniref:Uncharacterized protein n=1 Tax=Dermacentor silvarum TaxID=543639 RepID=A0ACB8D5L0_DERSI|nr:hypothetical protein HPB49_012698 [Dermacentor silvarum]